MAAARKAKHPPAPSEPASYTVLARRYRPQRFEEVVSQGHVAQALVNAIRDGRVAHAYLFAGPRGIGKTSMARIFARALNCQQGPTPEPCGQCDPCQAILAGEDVDVLEIDGASNNGVDEIRHLRQNVGYRASRSRYKIYIIDEVHMLSTSAFNALLKTLEEPPAHVKFIFATTEPHKLPATVLSRCQRFDFVNIPLEAIVERLKQIVRQEHVEADEEALELIARRANGGMRDSQSLLDQVLAFGGGRATVAAVRQLFGTAADQHVRGLIEQMAARDGAGALATIEAVVRQGAHLGEFVGQLMDYGRDLMVLAGAGPGAPLVALSRSEAASAAELARRWGLANILAALQILSEASYRLRAAGGGRLHLEMAVMEICQLETLAPVAEMAARLEQLADRLAGQTRSAATGPSLSADEPGPACPAGRPAGPEASAPGPSARGQSGTELWTAVLESFRTRQAYKILALATEGRALAVRDNVLVVGFGRDRHFHRTQCEHPENRRMIEETLSAVAGRPMTVQWTTLGPAEGAAPSAPAPVPAAEAEPASPPPAADTGRYRRHLEAAMADPLVRKALDQFAGRIVRIDWRTQD